MSKQPKPLNKIIAMAEEVVSEASEYGEVAFVFRFGNRLIVRAGCDNEEIPDDVVIESTTDMLELLYS